MASVSTRPERPSEIAFLVGAVLREKYSRRRGWSVSAAVVNAMNQRNKRANTANLVGVACKDAKEENSFKPTRPIVSAEAVSVTIRQKKQPGTIVYQGAGAVLTERSSRVRRNNARRGAVSITLQKKKRSRISEIARRAGSVSTENLCWGLRWMRRKEGSDVTLRHKTRPSIADRVGVASTEKSSRARGRIVRKRAVNATLQNERRSRIEEIVSHQAVGAVSMERSSRVLRNNVRSGAASISLHKKKHTNIAGDAGSASMEDRFGFQRLTPKKESCNVTAREKRQRRIVGCAGVACPDATLRKWFMFLRKNARGTMANVSLPRTMHAKLAAAEVEGGAASIQPPA
jgi:uncharacterized protein GlcG (DUF336 family)